jgi:hypothetical protein
MATLAASPVESAPRLAPMRGYLLAMAIGALLTFATLAAALASLKAYDALPPPQFSNSLCIDEKLHSMRAAIPADPNLLIVGSSVAWRHFNSPAAIAADPSLRPFNAGFCGARMTQVRKVSAWLTARLPSVRHVLLIASPLDFENCTKADPSQFDVFDADAYIFGKASPARFYARYFDPLTLAHNAGMIRTARGSMFAPEPLFQNSYGDAPNQPDRSRGLFYGAAKLDPACFAALRQTARLLERKGVAFDVTITPLHPEWVRRYGGGAFATTFPDTIRASLAGTGARYDTTRHQPDPGAFYDAIHIRWSATAAYTRSLLSEPLSLAVADGVLSAQALVPAEPGQR